MLHHTKKVLFFAGKSLFFAILFFVLFILVFTGYVKKRAYDVGDRMYPNVYIDNRNVGMQSKSVVAADFEQKRARLAKLVVYVQYDGKEATFSAKTLNVRYDTKTALNGAYAIGRNPDQAKQAYEQIRAFLNLGRHDFASTLNFDQSNVREFMQTLSDSYDREPEDALFTMENGRVTAFQVEKNGVRVNTKEALAEIDKRIKTVALDERSSTVITITVADSISKPLITLASSNDFGIVEKIGEATSNYAGSIPGRIHNVILGTSKFNGIIIPKGTIFSFNNIVGDISAATGYAPAYIIKDGKTILGDGGGICQVSTTLFRAALNTGLPIVERHAHAYRVHYYENDKKPGFDATVFSPSVDFKFKNDTGTAMLLQTYVDKVNQTVYFTLYGKKDGRKVTVTDATIWDIIPAPEPKFQDDPTLKRGTQKQVDWAAPGTKSRFHYTVTKGEEVIQDKEFYSNYRAWQAIYLVGTGD